MSNQALYRRWRPQRFEDVIGQPHIVQTLRNALRTDRLAHAYLFTGPRGTGKTSVARLLAKAACCTVPDPGDRPCNRCGLCLSIAEGRALDLIEIDAASNTGVDDVRELRDKIGFSPNEARYKVYIIDEVHMLSSAAFNALLKTLEEPPAHAIFILATTEPHKVPDTILSRCQRHDFRRVGLETVVEKLARICEAEGAGADRAALELIARSGTGSIRDAESLLDQLLASGEAIDAAAVRQVLGTPPDELVAGLVDAILDRDAGAGLGLLGGSLDGGADPRQIAGRLLEHLRAMLLLQTGLDPRLLDLSPESLARLQAQAGRITGAALVPIIHRFNAAPPAANRAMPGLPLELALVESVLGLQGGAAAPAAPPVAAEVKPAPARAPEARKAPAPSQPVAVALEPASPEAEAPEPDAAVAEPPPAAPVEAETVAVPDAPDAGGPVGDRGETDQAFAALLASWPAVLGVIEQRDRNLAALLRDARPVSLADGRIELGFFYPFHAKRADQPDKRAVILAALKQLTGAALELRCTVVPPTPDEQASRPRSKTEQAGADPLVRHAVERLGARIGGIQDLPEEPKD